MHVRRSRSMTCEQCHLELTPRNDMRRVFPYRSDPCLVPGLQTARNVILRVFAVCCDSTGLSFASCAASVLGSCTILNKIFGVMYTKSQIYHTELLGFWAFPSSDVLGSRTTTFWKVDMFPKRSVWYTPSSEPRKIYRSIIFNFSFSIHLVFVLWLICLSMFIRNTFQSHEM
jgi:hypothetical protein